MSDYQKLDLVRPMTASAATAQTAEGRYWSKFNVASITKEFGAVNHIDFSPVEPHNYAVTASTRVMIIFFLLFDCLVSRFHLIV
jgi:U3 small nucleolar RNA-associated protein 15